jgi:hypothetical protein
MYCPYCQTSLVDDAIFCTKCGKNVQPKATPGYREQQEKSQLKANNLLILDQVVQHFSQKQKVYDQYDSVCHTLNWLSRGASNALVIWGGILLGLFALGLLNVIVENLGAPSFYQLMAPVAILLLFVATPGCVMLLSGISKIRHHKLQLDHCRKEYMELSRELYQHYCSYPDCPIPPEYTNPRILAKIKWLVLSEQAYTVKESLDQVLAQSNRSGYRQYHETTIHNAADCNWQTGIKIIFLPPRYFK